MAPEVLSGAQATRRSDIYSMGAVLFELCAGAPPHYNVPLEKLFDVVPVQPAPPLRHVAPSVDSRFAAIVDRCLKTNPLERFSSAEDLRQAMEQLVPAAQTSSIPEGNPYRGLLPFEAEHRTQFYGRRSEIGNTPSIVYGTSPAYSLPETLESEKPPCAEPESFHFARRWAGYIAQLCFGSTHSRPPSHHCTKRRTFHRDGL